MKNFLAVIFFILIFTLSSSSSVQSEEYFCSGDDFFLQYDSDAKMPDVKRCEHLRNYTLSYDSCIGLLKDHVSYYIKAHKAYKEGKCQKYRKVEHNYGSATCSAKYIVTPSTYSYSFYGGTGNISEQKMCKEDLINKIMQEQKSLKENQK